MAKVLPPAGFEKASLHLHTVKHGLRFGRIYLARYPDPLGFGKTPSRFSDPRRRKPASRFGVLYLGDTFRSLSPNYMTATMLRSRLLPR